MGILGLGTQEIILIAVVGAIFLFGAPKVKEWLNTFKETKKEAKQITSE